MESIKIVTNTAQQIALQLKELESLPEKVLQSYKDAFQASIEKVTQATKEGGILSEEGDWRVWWNEVFPSMKQGEETFLAERSIDTSIQEVLSMQNQKISTMLSRDIFKSFLLILLLKSFIEKGISILLSELII